MVRILCLEGVTGAGKTTQIEMIGELFIQRGQSFLAINEKEFDPFKQKILSWHNLGANREFSYEQIEEIARARGETHKIHFRPKLEVLDYMVFDRSLYTSAVYQEGGELNSQEIIDLNIKEGAIIPEKGVVLICSAEIARTRIDKRRLKNNKYDLPSMHESIEEISKRRELYIQLVRQHPELCLIDTTNKTEDEVFYEVRRGLGI
jgi:thymidylate kinase